MLSKAAAASSSIRIGECFKIPGEGGAVVDHRTSCSARCAREDDVEGRAIRNSTPQTKVQLGQQFHRKTDGSLVPARDCQRLRALMTRDCSREKSVEADWRSVPSTSVRAANTGNSGLSSFRRSDRCDTRSALALFAGTDDWITPTVVI